jgi:hypothetical protein
MMELPVKFNAVGAKFPNNTPNSVPTDGVPVEVTVLVPLIGLT